MSRRQLLIACLIVALCAQVVWDATFANIGASLRMHSTYYIIWALPLLWLLCSAWNKLIGAWKFREFLVVIPLISVFAVGPSLVFSRYIPQTALPVPYEYVGLSEHGAPNDGQLFNAKHESAEIEAYQRQHPKSMPYIFFFWEGGYQWGFNRVIDDYLYPDTVISQIHFFLACGPPLLVDSCLRALIFVFPVNLFVVSMFRLKERYYKQA